MNQNKPNPANRLDASPCILIKARIEDVVVDSDARGKGIGKALLLHGLAEVRVPENNYRFVI